MIAVNPLPDPSSRPLRATIVALNDPWGAQHGGTIRARLVAEAVAATGMETTCVFHSGWVRIDRAGSPVDELRTEAPAGKRREGALFRTKRRYIPRPTSAGARNGFLSRTIERLGPTDLLFLPQVNFRHYQQVTQARWLWQDFPDVWTEVLARETEGWRGLRRITAAVQKKSLARHEVSLARRSSIVTAAGWGEAQRLKMRTQCPVRWLPTAISGPVPLARREAGQAVRAGFLANFRYKPNMDAFEHLIAIWLPRMRELGWRLVVAGYGSDALSLPADAECLGAIDSVRSFYEQVDLTLAPVRLGGGIKVKVIESLAYNRPVVGTTFALEGLSPAVRQMAVGDDREPPLLTNWQEPAIDRDIIDALFLERGFKEHVAKLLRTNLT